MSSLWLDYLENKSLNKLEDNLSFDVCIIGAGIFGLTCAYYLSKAGLKVCVLEKDSIVSKTTGHTTAKVTSQHNLFYSYLIDTFGTTVAKDYLSANEEAINNIKKIIDDEKIKCDFEYQSNFVYTTNKTEVNQIKKEVEAVNSLGFPANFVTKTGLPFSIEGAVQFPHQAQFNPVLFSNGLVKSILNNDGRIFENTTVFDVKNINDSFESYTIDGKVKSKYVVLACHYPFLNFPGMYFLKMYQSTSYIVAIDTKKSLFNGMYISSSDPIFSFRAMNYNGKKLLLLGGCEHKTGAKVSYDETYGLLENYARQLYPNCEIVSKWNTEDCISLDKLPYIGRFSNSIDNIFIATGFKKWGMTTSNVSANIITDLVLGNYNPYYDIFDSTRVHPIKNKGELKNIVVDSVNSLFINKIKNSKVKFEDIALNSGGIIEIDNTKVGIYKDINGKIYAINPICTHLGCLLSWNDIDKTWDCPCHGSRFSYDGKNIYGPAFKDLSVYNLDS